MQFPLTSIIDRGRRPIYRDPDQAGPEWLGLDFDEEALFAIHYHLHSVLLPLLLAGYEAQSVILGAKSSIQPDMLEFKLTPRSASTINQASAGFTSPIETYIDMPANNWQWGDDLVMAIALKPRSGYENVAVALEAIDNEIGNSDTRQVYVQGTSINYLFLSINSYNDILTLAKGFGDQALIVGLAINGLIVSQWETKQDLFKVGILRIFDTGNWALDNIDVTRHEAFNRILSTLTTYSFATRETFRAILNSAVQLPQIGKKNDDSVKEALTTTEEESPWSIGLPGVEARTWVRNWVKEAKDWFREETPEEKPPFRKSDQKKLSWYETATDLFENAYDWYFGEEELEVPEPDIQRLKLGDHDKRGDPATVIYDSQNITIDPNAEYVEVKILQDNLANIGLIEIVGAADGNYSSRTAIAVAIFQGFASIKARDDINNGVVNPIYLKDSVTGNADAYTRYALRRFINENIPLPIQSLQLRLSALGFGDLLDKLDGAYTWQTFFGVREFQSYATMEKVAVAPEIIAEDQPIADQYLQIINTFPYSGSISGALDADTDEKMNHWEVNRIRCPVIIEAWNMKNHVRNTLFAENFWRHNAMIDDSVQVFARDLSNKYELPVQRQADDRIIIGHYTDYLGGSGPVSFPFKRETWSPETEFLPEVCTSDTWENMNAAQQSTFRAIRSICEIESMGFLDCMNAYDRAVVSSGPYHWTICLMNLNQANDIEDGELMGYFALLRDEKLQDYGSHFEAFGVRPEKEWENGGASHFHSSHRKYTDWIRLEINKENFVVAPRLDSIGDYFRSWHWFYRVQMMCRVSTDAQLLMWTYARMRMRDVLETAWGADAEIEDGQGSEMRPAKIGDYYTSEKAIAMITRWHVYRPYDMVLNGESGKYLRSAFEEAAISGDPSSWTDANEQTLIEKLRDKAVERGSKLGDDLKYIYGWPSTMKTGWSFTLSADVVGDLQATRNSLNFDKSGLPIIS